MKVLFLGNSITRHNMKTEIGWNGDYGMAASCPEKDYVHVFCSLLEKNGKHVIFKAENISCFETDPGRESIEQVRRFSAFGADLVFFRIGENVSSEKADAFGAALPELLSLFRDTTVLVVGSFWKNDKVEQLTQNAAERCGMPYLSLRAIQGKEYEAVGEYEHAGVAAHPSDKGMRAIAEILYDAVGKTGLLAPPEIPAFIDDQKEKTDYSVSVDGRKLRCHSCRVSAMPFNTVWPGHQRPIEQTEVDSFVSFDMSAPADLCVKLARRTQDVVIRPLGRNIETEILGDEVYFTIREPGQYVLEVDGRHNVLHIFANPKETSDPSSATYRYENGVFEVGRLRLNSGESVYIGADAVVNGEIESFGSENIRIYGRGILDGSKYKRTPGDCEIGGNGLLNFRQCRNVAVNGIILRDSCMWTATSINCVGMEFCNVKVIGMWRYNSDGFDFVNSQNIRVRDCFLRTFDDAIVLKGLRFDDKREVEKMNLTDYVIENCVVWCDWGGALEIGAETVADEYKDIVFRNCDVIRTDQGALRIHSGDRAEIHDVLYENIRVEYSRYDTKNVYQSSDELVYEPGEEPAHDAFIKAWMYCGVWTKDNIPGHVHDITYRNIRVYKDENVPEPGVVFNGADERHGIENVTLDGIFMNGQPLRPMITANEYTAGIMIR